MLDLVPEDGSSVGNKSLRETFLEEAEGKHPRLTLDEKDYWDVRNELIEDGLLNKGRGQGGSVYRQEIFHDHSEEEIGSDREREDLLYEPFSHTISTYWVRENGLRDFIIEETARQGSRSTGGAWTRPDVTLVSVNKYPYVPGKVLEVTAFEIKPRDHFDVRGVFESAAFSIFSHKTFLSIFVSDDPAGDKDFERVKRECKRFNVGLLTFEDPEEGDTFEIQVEATRKDPDPSEINEFIQTQISQGNRNRLLEMLK